MSRFEIVNHNETSVAVFPSEHVDAIRKCLTLLTMSEYTPFVLAYIKFVKFEKWDAFAGRPAPHLLNMIRDMRESCRVLECSPYSHFRASLKECRDFFKEDIAIAIPRGFLQIISEIGIEFEEVV